MTKSRWLITILSFAAVLAVSAHIIVGWARGGVSLSLPGRAHLLALLVVAVEIAARSQKLSWSAKALGVRLPFFAGVRTSLGGDFGAAITPARSGAEPARFLILAEARIPAASALLILFSELFLEVLSLAFVVAIAGFAFRHAGPVLGALVGVVGGYAAFVLGLGLFAFLLSRNSSKGPPPEWARSLRLHAGRWRVVQKWLRQVRHSVNAMRDLHPGYAILSFLASVVHVAVRLALLPALVLTSAPTVPLAPLALWPFALLYGVAVVPAPGGGGAVEVAFKAALGDVIPHELFGAALLWWRFYTFYLYIILGALVAGAVVMRALRKEQEMEEELATAE